MNAHTRGQLAFRTGSWPSEANGTRGISQNRLSFNLLGGLSHVYELTLTLEWIRRPAESQEELGVESRELRA